MTAILSSQGQITLPQQVREALGLKPGQKIDFEVLPDGRVELKALNQATLDDLKSVLPKTQTRVSMEEMDEEIGQSVNDARN